MMQNKINDRGAMLKSIYSELPALRNKERKHRRNEFIMVKMIRWSWVEYAQDCHT